MSNFSYYAPDKISRILSEEDNVYFIGIGGVSMSSLAEISKKKVSRVAGSDRTLSPVTEALEAEGIKVYEGHHTENCRDYTVFVYNSAIHEDNPEYTYAKENGCPLIRTSP